jgi:hypothetical protein
LGGGGVDARAVVADAAGAVAGRPAGFVPVVLESGAAESADAEEPGSVGAAAPVR